MTSKQCQRTNNLLLPHLNFTLYQAQAILGARQEPVMQLLVIDTVTKLAIELVPGGFA